MKKLATILIASLTLAACSDQKASETKSEETTTTAAADGHEHTFRCPMHPEVTGKEGETCPKCGMKLEHSDDAPDASGTYFMQFASNPATITAGKEVQLSVTPKKKGADNEQVALDVEHEKKIHFILVSDDLSWFDHIHPEYTASGAYTTPARFPAPGKYKAFADYKPTGGTHVVDKIDIDVPGPAPAAKTFTTEKLTGTSGAYTFELHPEGGKLVTGTPLHIAGVIRKDGKEIDANSLDNYLGAKAHFVLISINEKEYLHVHPEVEAGKFDLHTTIDKPGTYRGWVQFNADGKIHTIDFTWLVQKGNGQATAPAGHGAGEGHNH
ncbi:MAG: hypothetical protein EOO16_01465 [Chitinophagaceae bacterium]|nr:MAG: hypothetical protein EOO16_01465 [Chitinophagaceae bacterium]